MYVVVHLHQSVVLMNACQLSVFACVNDVFIHIIVYDLFQCLHTYMIII